MISLAGDMAPAPSDALKDKKQFTYCDSFTKHIRHKFTMDLDAWMVRFFWPGSVISGTHFPLEAQTAILTFAHHFVSRCRSVEMMTDEEVLRVAGRF